MPTDSTAAPRPYWPPDEVPPARGRESAGGAAAAPPSADADKQHRPREGRACLLDLPVAREQRHERALRPVVDVPGRVAEVAHVGAARDVQSTPDRFARHGDEQVT